MSFAAQIKLVRKARSDAVATLEKLVNDTEKDQRALNEEEQKQYDTLKSEITVLDGRIKTLEDTESLVAANASQVVPTDANDNANGGSQSRSPQSRTDMTTQRVKGGFFARQAHLLFLANGNQEVAAMLAERAGDKEMGAVLRVAQTGADSATAAWAGNLLQQEMVDFIDLLRPMSVFARVPAGTVLAFDSTNSFKIPRATTGTPGGFVAEGGAIPVKTGAFGTVVLTPSKLGVITVATREILARSTPALETILRDMMLRDTAITLDRRFFCATAAGSGAPAGLLHTDNAPAAITASNVSNAGDDAIADLRSMMQAMYTTNVPMGGLVWLMHPSKKLDLANLRSATGAFYFRDELLTGVLQGIPVLDSAVLDKGLNDGGATNIRTVALVDASLLVKGNGISPTIALSNDATLHMDDAPNADILVPTTGGRSLFQTDSTALRLTWETTWRMRHTVGVQYVNGVNW